MKTISREVGLGGVAIQSDECPEHMALMRAELEQVGLNDPALLALLARGRLPEAEDYIGRITGLRCRRVSGWPAIGVGAIIFAALQAPTRVRVLRRNSHGFMLLEGAGATGFDPLSYRATAESLVVVEEIHDVNEFSNLRGIRDIFSIAGLRKPLLQLIVISSFVSALTVGIPLVVAGIVDKVIVHRDTGSLVVLSILLAGIALGESLLSLLRNYLFNFFSTQVTARLASVLFNRLFTLQLRELQGEAIPGMISRIQAINTVNTLITDTSIVLAVDSMFLTLFAVGMFLISPPLAFAGLTLLIVLGLVTVAFAKPLEYRHKKLFDANASYQDLLIETFHAMETVKTLGLEPARQAQLEQNLSKVLAADFSRRVVSSAHEAGNLLLSRAIAIVTVSLGAYLVIQHKITLGQVLAFYVLLQLILGPAQRLAGALGRFNEVKVALQKVKELVSLPAERSRASASLANWDGSISIAGMSFSYALEKQAILKNVTATLEPGSRVALVGDSGSGKSTFVKIVGGLLTQSKGHVAYGGHPNHLLAPSQVRRSIAHAAQDGTLFKGTVLQNLTAGRSVDFRDISAAAQICQVSGFIELLESSYNAEVLEEGKNFSRGQRQRLVLCRELLRNAPLLILDEATSALDERTEQAVFEGVLRHRKGLTTLFVTHNPALLRYADRVWRIQGGCVAEDLALRELAA